MDGLDDIAVDQLPHCFHREQWDPLGLAVIAALAADGMPGTRVSTSWSIDAWIERVKGEREPVLPGAEPGRPCMQLRTGEDQEIARQIPDPVDQVARKSSSPASAYWASSTSSTIGSCAVNRSKNSWRPANSSLGVRRGRAVPWVRDAEQPADADGPYARSSGSGRTDRAPAPAWPRRLRWCLLRPCPAAGGRSPPAPRTPPLAIREAAAPVPPHGLGEAVNVLLEFPAQPGLAHPGRPGEQDQPGTWRSAVA